MSRQVLDLLIGYTVTPVLWKYISRNSKTKLSAGRCQTPALQLIYDREQEIASKPGDQVYKVTAEFGEESIPHELNHSFVGEEEMVPFLKKTKKWSHTVSVTKPKIRKKKSPIPFTTSSLQQKASNILGFSPKKTMQVAQKLYEKGFITYMRTDSKKFSPEFIDSMKAAIKEKYGEEYFRSDSDYLEMTVNGDAGKEGDKESEKTKKGKKAKKGKEDEGTVKAQEAHEAIRPTSIDRNTLSERDSEGPERRLYALIWNHTMESGIREAECLSITSIIDSPYAETIKKCVYRSSAEKITFPGWKIVQGYDEEHELYDVFMRWSENEGNIALKTLDAKVTIKNLKSHFTEAKLVQILEERGIGRPSTFSSIVTKIQDREYVLKENVEGKEIACVDFEMRWSEDKAKWEIARKVDKRTFGNEKNKLVLQPKGKLVIEFLLKHFSALFNYDYTKNMENILDAIGEGLHVWNEPCQRVHREMTDLISTLQKASPSKPAAEKITIKVDEHHTYMIGRYGPCLKCVKDGKTTFKGVKRGIDIDKLKAGEYTLEEIVYVKPKKTATPGRSLGEHAGVPVVVKKGPYGVYMQWRGVNKSCKYLRKDEDDITMADAKKLYRGEW